MIRFIFRFIGLFALAGGFVALLLDGTRSIAADKIVVTPLAELWGQAHPESLQAAQEAIERSAPAWLWDPATTTVLATPGWVVLGVLGSVLLLLGRRRRTRRVGYAPRR
jgi:hypothetical protein